MAVDLPSLYLLDARMGWTLSSSEGVIPLGDSTLGLARPDTAPATGRCVLGPLDGRVANCVWDEIALEFAALPPGGKLAVRTFATDGSDRPFTPPLETADGGENGGPGGDGGDHLWTPPFEFAAGQGGEPAGPQQPERRRFLVQSPPGRYLWLRLDLSGSGAAAPALAAIRVTFPREGLSRQLPRVFTSADNPVAQFLDRFLAIFGSIWADIDREVADLPGRYLPTVGADEATLRWLAGLIALRTAFARGAAQRLLEAAPALYPARGTPAALQVWLAAALSAISGVAPERLMGFPLLIEGFRERRWLLLDVVPRGGLDTGVLWGAGLAPRLVLGDGGRLGEIALGRGGDATVDALGWLASRLRVMVPACWLADDEALRRFEAALAAELPAHVSAEVNRLEPGLCLGLQSTVGVDTVIGDFPPALLGVSAGPRAGSILNYDTLLAPERAAGEA